MDKLIDLEEKIMLAVEKIRLLKDENTRLHTTLAQADNDINTLIIERDNLTAQIGTQTGLVERNQELSRERQDVKERVERIIGKVDILAELLTEEEIDDDANEAEVTETASISETTELPDEDENEDEDEDENEVTSDEAIPEIESTTNIQNSEDNGEIHDHLLVEEENEQEISGEEIPLYG